MERSGKPKMPSLRLLVGSPLSVPAQGVLACDSRPVPHSPVLARCMDDEELNGQVCFEWKDVWNCDYAGLVVGCASGV